MMVDLLTAPSVMAGLGLIALALLLAWRAPAWGDIWDDLLTPGSDGSAGYRRAVIGIAHAMLGAAMAAPLMAWGGPEAALIAPALRAAVALIYSLVKEAGDLRRGGTLADGIEDTIFVHLGTFYGPWWWPLCMLAAGGAVWAFGATGGRK